MTANSANPPSSSVPFCPRTPASVQFLCPRCEEMFLCSARDLGAMEGRLSCPHCRLPLAGPGKSSVGTRAIDRCWVCGNEQFYIQKDFNRELGFMIVLFSAVIVSLVMLLIDHIFGVVCLMGIAAVDWMAYRMLANVTVCYLCQSIYRGLPLNPEHHGFYLGYEEKYKKRRQEWVAALLGEAS